VVGMRAKGLGGRRRERGGPAGADDQCDADGQHESAAADKGEAAERWIEWSLAAPYAVLATALPKAGGIEIPNRVAGPAFCSAWMPTPAAEPIARLVEPSASGEPVAYTRGSDVSALRVRDGKWQAKLPYTAWMPLPAAEPVACFVTASVAERLRGLGRLPSLTHSAFSLSAELEPLPALDAIFEPPALCARWMAVPPPEPVWSHLSSSTANELRAPIAQSAPLLASAVAGVYVPVAGSMRAIPQAEPVMAGVWPRVAETPISSIGRTATLCLPQISDAIASHELVLASSAGGSVAAEPVEALLIASQAALPLNGAAALHAPEISAVPTAIPAPATAPACAGPEAESVETLLVAALAGPMISAAPLRLQTFEMAGSGESSIPVLDQPRVAATPAAPAAASGKVLVLRPISTIRVAVPEPRHESLVPAIPCPGLVAVEYHIQRTRGAAFARLEWKSPRNCALSLREKHRSWHLRFSCLRGLQPRPRDLASTSAKNW